MLAILIGLMTGTKMCVTAELSHVFGVETLMYVIGLASGCTDYLPRLPKPLLIRIIKMLSAEDVGRLMQVSKQFYEVCARNLLLLYLIKLHKSQLGLLKFL